MPGSPGVDLGQLIEQQKFGRFQLRLMLWACAFMLVEGNDMQVMGYAAPAIIAGWHLAKADFTWVFTAGLAGFMLGALALGNLGDRYGRKRMILCGTLGFGLFTLAGAWAGSLQAVLALRFVASIGLGGAIPNAVALVAEYAPSDRRATRVGILFIGYTAGGALGGFLAARLIPEFGWPSVFLLGGAAPVAIALGAAVALPESARFLALRGGATAELHRILRRLRPELALAEDTRILVHEERQQRFPVRQLFAEGRAAVTVALWVAYAANMVAVHFLTSWLPVVVSDSGIAMSQAVVAGALLQLGGAVGSPAVGWLLDRRGILGVAAVLGVAAPCMVALGLFSRSEGLLMALILVAGLGIIGGQAGINALAGTLYPTYMRATGTGWAFGIGRVGSILGPVLGGALISFGLPISILFGSVALPLCCAAAALVVLARLSGGTPRHAPPMALGAQARRSRT